MEDEAPETSTTETYKDTAITEETGSHIVTTTTTTTEVIKKVKKHPEKPLLITRADDSFEENEEDSSGDLWDETPNASPEHKSFREKLAWAKSLDEKGNTPGNSPSKSKKAEKNESKDSEEAQEEVTKVTSTTLYSSSKSKKSRPPLSPGYRKAVGGVIREEDEEFEDALPEYTKAQGEIMFVF